MLTRIQIHDMVTMQNDINLLIDPDWVQTKNPFLLAAMMEAVEGIDHHGWKWWKAQSFDLAQLQMELVDIWHFIIADTIISEGSVNKAVDHIHRVLGFGNVNIEFDYRIYDYSKAGIIDNMRLMTAMFAVDRVSISLFMHVLSQCAMSQESLYTQYISKNVLNIFRQKNGYKEGTYRKTWIGKEDNVHLTEIMDDLDPAEPNYAKRIMTELEWAYVSFG